MPHCGMNSNEKAPEHAAVIGSAGVWCRSGLRLPGFACVHHCSMSSNEKAPEHAVVIGSAGVVPFKA